MKRFLIALSLLVIAGCGSGEDEDSAPTPSSEDGDAPATSRRPPAPAPPPMAAQPMPMPGAGGQGGQSAVALPPMAAANKAPEAPSKTGSETVRSPTSFDTDKFIASGSAPKNVRSAKPGQVVATPGPAGAGGAPGSGMPMGGSAQMMRPPTMPQQPMPPGR